MEEYVIFYVRKASGFSFEYCRFLHSFPQDFFPILIPMHHALLCFLIKKYQNFMES